MDAEQSQLLQTALRFIQGYQKWDIEAILDPRAENCTQQVFPASLGLPKLNNSQYREYLTNGIMAHFTNFQVNIVDVVEDTKRSKVVMHAQSQADTAIGPYANEYVLLLQMTDDHKQVVSIKEFVDSQSTQTFFPKLRAHIAQNNAQ